MKNPLLEIHQKYGFNVAHCASLLVLADRLTNGGDEWGARMLCLIADIYTDHTGIDRRVVMDAVDHIRNSIGGEVMGDLGAARGVLNQIAGRADHA